MSVSWEHAYGACRPAAAAVLRAVTIVDLEVVSSSGVGVASGLSADETAAVLGELERGGWAVPVAGVGYVVSEQGRKWLARQAKRPQSDDVIKRFVGFHAAAVDRERRSAAEVGEWLGRHRGEVLAAVRACDRAGLRGDGTRLALDVWASAGLVVDPRWWEDVAAAGEALAIADRDPRMLAELLHHSAETFAGHGDRRRAEAQWVRALAVVRREHGPNEVAILTGLSGLYREWGRLGKALDAELGLLDLRRQDGDPQTTAAALGRVAETMWAAGRLDSAVEYLTQADDALAAITEAGAPDEILVAHAHVLVRCGHALWESGKENSARRFWSRALAMMIDIDDNFADKIRELLANGPA